MIERQQLRFTRENRRSRHHFDDLENSCPMVALPSDVARSDERVKTAFEAVFKAMVTVLGRDVRNSSQPRENTAMAIAALCIGGMVVARSMNDRSLGDQLRDAAINAALELGSWTPSKAQPNIKREPRRKKQSASTYSSVT